jgi:hypothetical protein
MKALNILQKVKVPIGDRAQIIFQMSIPSHSLLSKSRNFNTGFGATILASGLVIAMFDSYQNSNSAQSFWHPYLIGTLLLGMGWGEKNALNNLQKYEISHNK